MKGKAAKRSYSLIISPRYFNSQPNRVQSTQKDIRFQIMNGDKLVDKKDPGLRNLRG